MAALESNIAMNMMFHDITQILTSAPEHICMTDTPDHVGASAQCSRLQRERSA